VVGCQALDACALEQAALWLAENDRDLRCPTGQALARPQEEGDAFPARVVDPGAQRDERLDGRFWPDAYLLPVARHLPPLDHTR
jgi:hypothetical protein